MVVTAMAEAVTATAVVAEVEAARTQGVTNNSRVMSFGHRTPGRRAGGLLGFALLWAALFSSCLNQHGVHVAELAHLSWQATEPVQVQVNNTDTTSRRRIFVVVRFSGEFAYNRLGLSLTTTSPAGLSWCDTLYVRSFEQTPPLGLSTDREQVYRSDVCLADSGQYVFTFRPVMPESSTQGVSAVGVRLAPEN